MRSLASFLTLGYFLDYRNPTIQIGIDRIDKQLYAKADQQELTDLGVALWREAIASQFEAGKTHVVPLSGGLDSRAVLAGLLEHTEARNIRTYTFGSPGTLDFEIGCYVADALGTRHTQFDLTQHTYRQEEMEDVSLRVDRQTILFHHCPVWEAERLFNGCVVWSGFLGDPLSGSHLPAKPAQDFDTAAQRFLEKNRYVTSMDLVPGSMDLASLLTPATVDRNKLTLEEQLDLRNRQIKFVAPHVLMRGFDYCTPFLYEPWVNFMLSVGNAHRRGQALYKRVLVGAFPSAFALKTKTNHGLALTSPFVARAGMRLVARAQRLMGRTSWGVNYLDFNHAIRHKADLRRIVEANVSDLRQRRVIDWLDVSAVLRDHQSGRANHADALLVLASLEIHLKTGLVL